MGILFSGLTHYFTDRFILRPAVQVGILDQSIPAYLSKAKPSFSFAIRHPKLPVPVLRTGTLSMISSILTSIPLPSQLALISLPLLVFPHWSNNKIAALVLLVSGPPIAVGLWNLWPLTFTAAAVVGAEVSFRTAAVAWLVTWVLDDVKKERSQAKVKHEKVILKGEEGVVVVSDKKE